MEADRHLDQIAAHQYGTFSRAQARTAGLTPRMIQTRVESGAWLRLAPAVYGLASAPPKWERQVAAALLTRENAIVAGSAAAHLHDFGDFRRGHPVIMTGLSANARSPLATVIRSQRFDDVARVRRSGFLVTDEAETVMTLARSVDEVRLEGVVDEILARKTCSAKELARVVDRSQGVPGIAKLRRIVDFRRPDAYQPPTSELERLLYRALDDPRLPPYTRQMPILYQRVTATVDAYLADWRLIVEGDGRRWHTRKADMERDRLRDNEAVAHGYAVLRFPYEVLRKRPHEVIDTILRTGRVRQSTRTSGP